LTAPSSDGIVERVIPIGCAGQASLVVGLVSIATIVRVYNVSGNNLWTHFRYFVKTGRLASGSRSQFLLCPAATAGAGAGAGAGTIAGAGASECEELAAGNPYDDEDEALDVG